MKLGYLTQPTSEEFGLAAEIGFDCIEARPQWDLETLRDPEFRRTEAGSYRSLSGQYGVEITALALYVPGPYVVAERIELYGYALDVCRAAGVEVLATLSGGDPEKNLKANLADFQSVFGEVGDLAEDLGLKIAFENWPGLSLEMPVRSCNFLFSPQSWEIAFEAVPSAALGLEFDPSHLVWQQADWKKALEHFIGRVHHVHAKDTEVFDDRLARRGFFSQDWWRYRIPGYGEVDWVCLTSMLKEAGYEGGVCIEHEDPVFSGERRAEGLSKGHDVLRPLM